MTAHSIMQTTAAFFKGFRKQHSEMLGLLCYAAFLGKRLSITALGRHLPTETVPKHAIKRVDRWLGNRRFCDREAREQFARLIVGPRKRIEISVDWTKMRRWPVLVAAMNYRGRAVPLLWSVADPKKLYKSQNAFEHGFLAWLRSTMPDGVQVVLLMDRGFKRVELLKVLRKHGFSFVIRTGGNVHIKSDKYSGRIDQWIWKRGQRKRVDGAVLRPSRPVTVNIVGIWRARTKEPWLLMTDLPLTIDQACALYAKRFQIEESFRDQKDLRFGLQLGHTLVTKASRLERWLLVAAVAHFLAMLYGAEARARRWDRGFRANTVKDRATHSDFTLGLFYAIRIKLNRSKSLEDFYAYKP